MSKEYSKWLILNKYYEAKRLYYGEGKSSLNDQEYDALEQSINAIHGDTVLYFDGQGGEWACVGYDKGKHVIIKKNMAIERKNFYSDMGYKILKENS